MAIFTFLLFFITTAQSSFINDQWLRVLSLSEYIEYQGIDPRINPSSRRENESKVMCYDYKYRPTPLMVADRGFVYPIHIHNLPLNTMRNRSYSGDWVTALKNLLFKKSESGRIDVRLSGLFPEYDVLRPYNIGRLIRLLLSAELEGARHSFSGEAKDGGAVSGRVADGESVDDVFGRGDVVLRAVHAGAGGGESAVVDDSVAVFYVEKLKLGICRLMGVEIKSFERIVSFLPQLHREEFIRGMIKDLYFGMQTLRTSLAQLESATLDRLFSEGLPLTNMVKLCEEKVTDGVVISCIPEVIDRGEMESYLRQDLTRELFLSKRKFPKFKPRIRRKNQRIMDKVIFTNALFEAFNQSPSTVIEMLTTFFWKSIEHHTYDPALLSIFYSGIIGAEIGDLPTLTKISKAEYLGITRSILNGTAPFHLLPKPTREMLLVVSKAGFNPFSTSKSSFKTFEFSNCVETAVYNFLMWLSHSRDTDGIFNFKIAEDCVGSPFMDFCTRFPMLNHDFTRQRFVDMCTNVDNCGLSYVAEESTGCFEMKSSLGNMVNIISFLLGTPPVDLSVMEDRAACERIGTFFQEKTALFEGVEIAELSFGTVEEQYVGSLVFNRGREQCILLAEPGHAQFHILELEEFRVPWIEKTLRYKMGDVPASVAVTLSPLYHGPGSRINALLRLLHTADDWLLLERFLIESSNHPNDCLIFKKIELCLSHERSFPLACSFIEILAEWKNEDIDQSIGRIIGRYKGTDQGSILKDRFPFFSQYL